MRNKKSIIKFIIIFILTFILLEIVEFLISYFFDVNVKNLKWGWLGIMIVYGFKYHIICCLVPAIWASYKCRHKKCKHEHCDGKENK